MFTYKIRHKENNLFKRKRAYGTYGWGKVGDTYGTLGGVSSARSAMIRCNPELAGKTEIVEYEVKEIRTID